MKFWYFWWTLFFFGKTREFYGVKSLLPFSKLMIGKSEVFQHAPTYFSPVIRIYAIGGAQCALPGQIGLINHLYGDQRTIWELFTKIWNHHLPSGWLQYLSHVRNQQTFGKTNMSSEFFVFEKSICVCNSRLNSGKAIPPFPLAESLSQPTPVWQIYEVWRQKIPDFLIYWSFL